MSELRHFSSNQNQLINETSRDRCVPFKAFSILQKYFTGLSGGKKKGKKKDNPLKPQDTASKTPAAYKMQINT